MSYWMLRARSIRRRVCWDLPFVPLSLGNCNKALLLMNSLLYGIMLKLTDERTGTKRGKKTLFHPVIKIHSSDEVSVTLSAPPVPPTTIVPCPNYCSTNSPLVSLCLMWSNAIPRIIFKT